MGFPPARNPEDDLPADVPTPPTLRDGLPLEKAVQVRVVEDSWADYHRFVTHEMRKRKPGRSAILAFERALVRVGHLAQPVRALLDELGIDSTEELKTIVNAYKMGQRATDADRVELGLQTLERHIVNHREAAQGILDRIRAAVGKVEQDAGAAGKPRNARRAAR